MATLLLIIGIAFFNYGADNAMTPIGKMIGRSLTKQGKVWILFLAVFAFGFLITVSEPDLSVLALQTKYIISQPALIISISVSVGFFMILAILKIVKKVKLIRLLSLLYMIAFGVTSLVVFQGKEQMIALSFDAGGVTTGPMTVPFLMALGAGVSSILSSKSEKDASFGFIAFSSIGPVIMMLVISIFSNKEFVYELADYKLADNFFLSYLHYLLEKLKAVGLSIGLIFACFLIVDIFILKAKKEQMIFLIRGLLFAYLGLVIFLAAVDSTYMGIGYKIGSELGSISMVIVIIAAFIIGALTVLAEPAIKILVAQVEEVTNRVIGRKSMLIALAIGVGIAIVLAFIRIFFKFSILYIIVPGYIICFVLSFYVPKIYTAIAFDAGGVASGPLTSSFILPIALGLCSSVNGIDSILSYGFGIVSLVALSPLLSIEILGVFSVFNKKAKAKKALKKVLKKDDKMIIFFGD